MFIRPVSICALFLPDDFSFAIPVKFGIWYKVYLQAGDKMNLGWYILIQSFLNNILPVWIFVTFKPLAILNFTTDDWTTFSKYFMSFTPHWEASLSLLLYFCCLHVWDCYFSSRPVSFLQHSAAATWFFGLILSICIWIPIQHFVRLSADGTLKLFAMCPDMLQLLHWTLFIYLRMLFSAHVASSVPAEDDWGIVREWIYPKSLDYDSII